MARNRNFFTEVTSKRNRSSFVKEPEKINTVTKTSLPTKAQNDNSARKTALESKMSELNQLMNDTDKKIRGFGYNEEQRREMQSQYAGYKNEYYGLKKELDAIIPKKSDVKLPETASSGYVIRNAVPQTTGSKVANFFKTTIPNAAEDAWDNIKEPITGPSLKQLMTESYLSPELLKEDAERQLLKENPTRNDYALIKQTKEAVEKFGMPTSGIKAMGGDNAKLYKDLQSAEKTWQVSPIDATGANAWAATTGIFGSLGSFANLIGADKVPLLKNITNFAVEGARKAQENAQQYNRGNYGEALGTVTQGVVNLVPYFLVGTGTTAVKGAAKVGKYAKYIEPIIKNPSFWYSLTSMWGQKYQEKLDEGNDRFSSLANAIIYALPAALIEVAGGIGAKGKEGQSLLRTMGEEIGEEISQDIVSGISDKITTNHDLPVFSTTEDAIVNPGNLAKTAVYTAPIVAIGGGANRALSNFTANRGNKNTNPLPAEKVSDQAQQLALPAPKIYVDPEGNAMTSNQQMQSEINPEAFRKRTNLINDINKSLNLSNTDKGDLLDTLKNTELTPENERGMRDILNIIENPDAVQQQVAAPVKSAGLQNITNDFNANKSKYAQYSKEDANYDKSYIDRSKAIIKDKQGRRTKEQWLAVAKNLGNQIYEMSDADIEKYAYKTWIDNKPNNAANLNRQGKGYTKFTMDEWVNAVYNEVRNIRGITQPEVVEQPKVNLPTQAEMQAKIQQEANFAENVPNYSAVNSRQVFAMPNIIKENGKTIILPTEVSKRTIETARALNVEQNDMNVVVDMANKLRRKIEFIDVKNPQIDGYVQNGTIYLNKNSKKLYQTVFKHELTHTIETAKEYTDFANAILDSEVFYDYISKKGYKLADYKNAIKESYAKENIKLDSSELDAEIVAKFVEENLFKDQKSINRLAQENPTVFQRLKNFIDDIIVKFSGSAEEKEIRKIQNMFKTAYDSASNNNAKSGTQYSVNESKYNLYSQRAENAYNVRDEYQQQLDSLVKTDADYESKYNKLKEKVDFWQKEANKNNAESKKYAAILDKENSKRLEKVTADEIRTKAVEEFGYTTDFREAGYMLPDGKLLNFSGVKGYHPGSRGEDHRGISIVYNGTKDGVGSMVDFINEGNIRVMAETPGIDISVMPTDEQLDKIKDFVEASKQEGQFIVDLSDASGKEIDSLVYEGRINTDKVINDIKKFFETGEVAKQSDIQKYRQYSISTDNENRVLSSEQKEYFKNSKVTDEDGRLKVIYHGTNNSGFTEFKRNVNYFTDNKNVAKTYTGNDGIYEGYLKIDNPITVDANGEKWSMIDIDNISIDGIDNIKKFLDTYGASTWREKGKMRTSTADLVSAISDAIDEGEISSDGIIIKNIFDEGAYGSYSGKEKGTDYITFDSNQFKNIDNTKPTESKDIRYSVTNPVDIAKNPPNIKTGLDALRRAGKEYEGDKQSHFAKNIHNQSIFDEKFKNLAWNDANIRTYESISNKETLNIANDAINENGQKWVDRFLEKPNGEMKATDIAGGFILMNRYQQAGDYESMIRVAEKLRKAGTQQGQTIQMFSVLGRMTPEGMTYYAQKELNNAFDAMLETRTQAWADQHADEFKLKEKDIEFIQRRVNQAARLPEGRDKYVLLGEIASRIQNKIPPQPGQGLKAFARNSMLLNPKTMVRNILGNVVITPSHIISDFIGSGIDKNIGKKTGVRTTGGFDIKSLSGVKKGLYESYDDFRRQISTREVGNDRFETAKINLTDSAKNFNENHTGKFSTPINAMAKALNGLDRVTGFLLESGDRPFYETWFINSLNNQMKLNNATEPSAEMIEIATDEALQRTWQDNNTYTKAVSGIRKSMNKINIKGYGLGDMVMPFVKTPANLTKAVVDFSPLGAINAVIKTSQFRKDIGKGSVTSKQQREVVKAWSQVITGTIGMAIMTALSDAGIIGGGSDDDKDVRAFEQNILGIKPYSVKIGDNSYTYDWAQPLGTSAAMVTDTVKSLKNAKDTESKVSSVLNGLQSGASVLLDQSFVSGIRNLFEEDNLINALIEVGTNEPAKFTPQFLSQLAQIQDNTARTSYVYNNKIATGMNKIKAKVPGLRQTLEPSVDVLGREVETNNSVGNVMFNPANTAFARSTKAAEEMYNVYKSTGDKASIAQVAPYYFNIDSEKIVLNPKQRTQYQKTLGKIASDGVENLIKNRQYKQLDDADKAEIFKDLYSYGNAVAKEEASDKYIMSKEYSKIRDSGMKPEEYILQKYISSAGGTTKDAMYNSLTSSGYSQKETEAFLSYYRGYKFDSTSSSKNSLPTLSSKQNKLPTLKK